MAQSLGPSRAPTGWRRRLATIVASGLDLLFPPVCAGCGHFGDPFCPRCAQAVAPIPLPICAHCGRPQSHPTPRCAECIHIGSDPLALLRAAALHTHPLRAAIHALKYEGHPELAPRLARYLTAVFADAPWTGLASPIDLIVPVPLHQQRQTYRGYNQAELLARAFGASVNLPVEAAWLQRVRDTRQQVGLGPRERHANVADAFIAEPPVAGRVLLLIDDVCTTGATLRACAAAAHIAGAQAVYALTLAIPQRASTARAPELPWWEGNV